MTVGQLTTNQHNQCKDGQRHEQREPFEGAIAKAGAAVYSCGRWLNWHGLVHISFCSLFTVAADVSRLILFNLSGLTSAATNRIKVKRTKSGRNGALRPTHA